MSFPDRRKHPRVVLISPILLKNKEKTHQGLIRNISVSGVGIESDEELSSGCKYLLEFSTAGFLPLKVGGVVRWAAKRENKNVYGIEFTELNPIRRLRIIGLVKKLMKAK